MLARKFVQYSLFVFGTCGIFFLLTSSQNAHASTTCVTYSKVTGFHPEPGPRMQWAGCNLQLMNMSKRTLTGSDLSGANLGATNLRGANLTGADLSGANLRGTNLQGAILTGVQSGDIVGTPASLPDGWKLRNGYLVGPGANLTRASLNGADLSYANLKGTILTGANLYGATLTGIVSGSITGTPTLPSAWRLRNGYLIGPGANLLSATLTGCDLSNTNLSGANLTRAKLSGVESDNIVGTPKSLPTGWKLINGYLIGPGAILTNASLANLNLSKVSLAGTVLTGASLTGVASGGISGVPKSLPTNWKIVHGYLIGPGANLANAALQGAHLTGANFSNSNLSGTNLKGATMSGVRSGNVTGTPSALPTNWKLRGGYLIGPGANLVSADLASENLLAVNLSGANLTGATLTGVRSGLIVGKPATLPYKWQLIKGYLMGPSANLTSADLGGADISGMDLSAATLSAADLTSTTLGSTNFSNADLTNADITGADVSKTNFSATVVTRLKSGDVTGVPAGLPANWKIVEGYLVGPTANLTSANLAYVDLSNCNLTGVDLTGADLSGANLQGSTVTNAILSQSTTYLVHSGGLIGSPASLPSDWFVRLGYLMGPSADLTGANLAGVDLTAKNLGQAVLDNAILTGANIAGTTFTSTSFYGLKSGNMTGSPASLPDGWTIRKGYLIGEFADLRNADLSGTDLSSLDLSGANLSGADLTSANLNATYLTDVDLTNVKSGSISGTPSTLPAGWSLAGGVLHRV